MGHTRALRYAAAIALAGTVASPAEARPGYNSGNELLELCTSRAHADIMSCMAFISGVVRGSSATSVVHGRPFLICLPEGVTVGQTVDVIVNDLRTHPEERHWGAEVNVIKAIQRAFPCTAQ